MNKEMIKSNFRKAHAEQLTKVADAQFVQFEAAAALAGERVRLREIEAAFKSDMAQPEKDTQLEIPGLKAEKK